MLSASRIESLHLPALGCYLCAAGGTLAWPEPLAGAKNPTESPAAAWAVAAQCPQGHTAYPWLTAAGTVVCKNTLLQNPLLSPHGAALG